MGTESDEDTAERLNRSTMSDKTSLLFQRSFCFICRVVALLQTLQTPVSSCILVNKQHESSPNWCLSPPIKTYPNRRMHTIECPIHHPKVSSTYRCKGKPLFVDMRDF